MFSLMRADASGALFSGPPARRSQRRPATEPALVHDGLAVRLATLSEIEAETEAWRDLAGRSLEPSVFGLPDFVLPALQHLPEARGAVALTVREAGSAGSDRLRGLIPLILPRFVLAAGETRAWQPQVSPLSFALIDRDAPDRVLEAALAGLETAGRRCAVVTLPLVATGGPIEVALRKAADRSGRRVEKLAATGAAPPLRRFAGEAVAALAASLAAKAVPAPGRLRIERARAARDVRDAVELFLVVEARAARWRGETGLIERPGAASFLRTATRQLARSRRCRVDILHSEGEARAAAILFGTAEDLWLWRVAGDEPDHAHRDALIASILEPARVKRPLLGLADPHLLAELDAADLALGRAEERRDLRVATHPGRQAAPVMLRVRDRIGRQLRALAGPRRPRPS